jgi:hypothetical protein
VAAVLWCGCGAVVLWCGCVAECLAGQWWVVIVVSYLSVIEIEMFHKKRKLEQSL